MEFHASGADLAKAIGIPAAQLEASFTAYNKAWRRGLVFLL